MYNYNRKKEMIKNIAYITVILLLAIISTYHIYHKFETDRNIDFNSESLDVTYHEATGDKLTITKITPVTDSVGLSSKSYNITIKNNLTEKVDFKIKVVDDLEKIVEDACEGQLIQKENIRISIKNGDRDNKIYTLNELEDSILLDEKMKALEERDFAVRIWISQNSTLPLGSNMHYHGIVQVVEDDTSVAINR